MTSRRVLNGGDNQGDRLARQMAAQFGGPGGLSRRSILRGAGIGALALSSASFLDACGTKGAKVA
jgi:spermidine/putrescine transport system substrate-binding protein